MNKFLKHLWLLIILVSVNASALNRVELSPQFFPNPLSDRAAAGARIYVGEPDLDPEIVANQKTVSAIQEDGSIVALTQPVITGAGGIPSYNGSPVTLLVNGAYSLKAETSSGTLLYYVPTNAVDGTPSIQTFNLDSLRSIGVIPSDGDSVLVGCRTTVANGGGGVFVWDSSSTASDDDAITVQQTGIATGRWIRQFDGPIHSSWFGSGQAGIQGMFDYASANTEMVIDPGNYTISSTIATSLPGYNTITAYGCYFTCTHNGVVFNFNESLTSELPMFRWFGGRFVNTNATKTASVAMYFKEWRNVLVESVRFESFWKAVTCDDRDTYTIKHCHFYANETAVEFKTAETWGTLILKFIDNHVSMTGKPYGLVFDGASGAIQIDGNSFNGPSATGTDVYFLNTNRVPGMRGISITNNSFEQGVTGQKYIHFDYDASGGTYKGVAVAGNAFKAEAGAAYGFTAITAESVDGMDVSGNAFLQQTDYSAYPINLDANCKDINFGANSWIFHSKILFSCPRSEISVAPYMLNTDNYYTLSSYNGAAFSTTTATIDMSAEMSSLIFPYLISPKGYWLNLVARDSASSTTSACRVSIFRDNTIGSWNGLVNRVGGVPNDSFNGVSGYVPCDANGDIYINISASGASTTDVYVSVTGMAF